MGGAGAARVREADLEALSKTSLARVVRLTREAGAIAMTHFQRPHARWEKAPGSLVTEADLAIDRFLKDRLPKGEDAWLSEESHDDFKRLGAQRVWIVDPIDGTRSYARGKPEFCVSVALWETGRIVLGVVLNPATEELFTVRPNGGARCDGEPMRVRGWEPGSAITLLVSGREAREAHFERLFQGVDVMRLGSIAYRLALVADGRADGLVTLRRIADWDLAAAVRMAEAAGAVVTDRRGRALRFNQLEPTHDGLIVAGPALHRRLLAHLEGMR